MIWTKGLQPKRSSHNHWVTCNRPQAMLLQLLVCVCVCVACQCNWWAAMSTIWFCKQPPLLSTSQNGLTAMRGMVKIHLGPPWIEFSGSSATWQGICVVVSLRSLQQGAVGRRNMRFKYLQRLRLEKLHVCQLSLARCCTFILRQN